MGILELDPFTAAEVSSGPEPTGWQHLWLTGGFPDAVTAHTRGGSFRDWWEAYLRTFVERDLPALGIGVEPILMRRLMTMIAHAQAGLANINQFASALGVAHGTVARYMDILEMSFLLRRLPPYFRNVGKRLVKSPKLFLRDTGLVHHLLNIGTIEELSNHPIRGASWETFVIEDMIRRERLVHPHSQMFFWRTAAGAEMDLVIDRGEYRCAIEVKTTRATSPHLVRTLRSAISDIGTKEATIIDQAPGKEALAPAVRRRGFETIIRWLPGQA